MFETYRNMYDQNSGKFNSALCLLRVELIKYIIRLYMKYLI